MIVSEELAFPEKTSFRDGRKALAFFECGPSEVDLQVVSTTMGFPFSRQGTWLFRIERNEFARLAITSACMTGAVTHPLPQMLDVDNAAAILYACEAISARAAHCDGACLKSNDRG
jgi:hypothetical protein